MVGQSPDEKITKILDKLLDPNTKISNCDYLNSFQTYIIKHQENTAELSTNDDQSNTLSCWIIRATNEWEGSKQKLSSEVLSFTLNLTAFISKDEKTFMKLNSVDVYERFIRILDINSAPTIIRVGFIKLISSFLEHKSGLHWTIATNYWTNIIALILGTHVLDVTSAGCKFIADLLDRTYSKYEIFCRNVIETITELIDSTMPKAPNTNIVHFSAEDVAMTESLIPVLRIISDVLHRLLERFNTAVLDIFLNDFKLICNVENLLLVARTEDLEFELRKVIFVVGFIDLYKYASEHEAIICGHIHNIPELRKERIFETLTTLIAKGYVKSVLKLCHTGLIYYKSIQHKLPKCFQKGQEIQLDIQLIVLQVIPLIMTGACLLGIYKFQQLENVDTLRSDYISKLIQISAPGTIYAAYQWKTCLLQTPQNFDIIRLTLLHILKSKSLYSREGGVVTFQTFTYSLMDIISHFKENSPNLPLHSEVLNVLELLLEALGIFIEDFNITWKDSYESLCVMILAVELLQISAWTPKIVVKALNLLNITISKYMSPCMVLLVDPMYDASLTSNTTLLQTKCHDACWEVRKSSLEVLCTMSYNANKRFPSFQKMILHEDLPHLVVKMAKNDTNPFVRASALRCLQEMIKVEQFWENLLTITNLHEQFFDILGKEEDGIVRKEAAKLVCEIYQHQYYQESILPNLYDIMTGSAISDVYWEVKVNALHFWHKVINRHLHNQGMIDGSFPEVTFSKENRKIVILNDLEVRKRLEKVLSQLSEIGCLTVLVTAIQDDSNVQVAKSATNIANEFVELLKRYDVPAPNLNLGQQSNVPRLSNTPDSDILKDIDLSLFNPPSPIISSSPVLQNVDTPFNCSTVQEVMDHNSIGYSLTYEESDARSSHSNSSSTQMEYQDITSSTIALDINEKISDDLLSESDTSSNITLKVSCENSNESVLSKAASKREKSLLSPSEFIRFTYSNLESNLIDKNNLLDSTEILDLLLENILNHSDIIDVSSMECY